MLLSGQLGTEPPAGLHLLQCALVKHLHESFVEHGPLFHLAGLDIGENLHAQFLDIHHFVRLKWIVLRLILHFLTLLSEVNTLDHRAAIIALSQLVSGTFDSIPEFFTSGITGDVLLQDLSHFAWLLLESLLAELDFYFLVFEPLLQLAVVLDLNDSHYNSEEKVHQK